MQQFSDVPLEDLQQVKEHFKFLIEEKERAWEEIKQWDTNKKFQFRNEIKEMQKERMNMKSELRELKAYIKKRKENEDEY